MLILPIQGLGVLKPWMLAFVIPHACSSANQRSMRTNCFSGFSAKVRKIVFINQEFSISQILTTIACCLYH
jgi:hypothetical protein